MLRIYTGYTGNDSSRLAIQWLDEYQMMYEEIQVAVRPLTIGDFKELLPYAKNGMDTFLTLPARQEEQLKDMSLNKVIDYLVKHPKKVRKPILFDGKKLEVGFSHNEIRCFIPREWRQEQRNCLNGQIEALNENKSKI